MSFAVAIFVAEGFNDPRDFEAAWSKVYSKLVTIMRYPMGISLVYIEFHITRCLTVPQTSVHTQIYNLK